MVRACIFSNSTLFFPLHIDFPLFSRLGEGVFGHPRVYINCDKSRVDDPVPCDYCGKRFVQRKYIPKDHPLLKDYVIPADSHHHH
jgi:uncharacterized Zn-finger protein